MHWFHFNIWYVRDIFIILHLQTFANRQTVCAPFCSFCFRISRWTSLLYFKDGRNSVAFFISKIRLPRFSYWHTRSHRVCHSNKENTLQPLPPNSFVTTKTWMVTWPPKTRIRNWNPELESGTGIRNWNPEPDSTNQRKQALQILENYLAYLLPEKNKRPSKKKTSNLTFLETKTPLCWNICATVIPSEGCDYDNLNKVHLSRL